MPMTACRRHHTLSQSLSEAASRLATYAPLSPADREAVEHLPGEVLSHRRGESFPAAGLHLIVSGWACKMRPVAEGRRQIFVFLLPGDYIGSFRSKDDFAFFDTVALTPLETVDLSPLLAVGTDESPGRPAVVRAGEGLEEQAEGLIFDHMVRLGARDVYGGLADLLLELHQRLRRVGQIDADGGFTLPIGQRVLADALGVSVVHINQTLKRLAADGLIAVDGATVRLPDPQRIASLGGFPRAPVAPPQARLAPVG